MNERAFDGPDEALLMPRVWIARLRPVFKRLGFPEPDRHWERTAQVNWTEPATSGERFLCLYLGHDLQERRVEGAEKDGMFFRRDCHRCRWEGPWTGRFSSVREFSGRPARERSR